MQIPRLTPPWDYGVGLAKTSSWRSPGGYANVDEFYFHNLLNRLDRSALHFIDIDENNNFPTTVERPGSDSYWFKVDNPTGLGSNPVDMNFRIAFVTPRIVPAVEYGTWDAELNAGSENYMFIDGTIGEYFGNFRIEINTGTTATYYWADLDIRTIALPGYNDDSVDNFRVLDGTVAKWVGDVSSIRIFGHIAAGVADPPGDPFDPFCPWFNSDTMKAIGHDDGTYYGNGYDVHIGFFYYWPAGSPGVWTAPVRLRFKPQAVRTRLASNVLRVGQIQSFS